MTNTQPGPLRGVNLGGWLVLEKWITPSVFAGTTATDEYSLFQVRSRQVSRTIREHRNKFIVESDFAWLARNGIEAVRLPVGYWLFGGEKPYASTVKYVDLVFAWAKKYKLKVLLCLHGAPGSQNGWDHSGRAGELNWPKYQSNITDTLDIIAKLAERYGRHPQLLGIELLNEPKWTVPKRLLKNYYEAAYKIVREHCGQEAWVVFHDNFRPRRWKRALRGSAYTNAYIDTHRYRCFSSRDKRHGISWHIKKTIGRWPRQLAVLARHHPVIVGEWSLALDRGSTGKLLPVQSAATNRAYGSAQLLAYTDTAAWFFWTYKTEKSPTWSYRESVERGWLPGKP